MKIPRMLVFTVVLGLVLMPPISVFGSEGSSDIAGHISFMIGDVYVSPDGKDWQEADFDMTVMDGQQIRTGEDSQCEITLSDQTIIRMDADSLQQIERAEVEQVSKGKSIFLSAGKVWVNARKMLTKRDSFKVRTNKAVCAIRGTTFSVDEGKEHTQVRVHTGQVATWSSLLKERAPSTDPQVLAEPVPVSGPHPVSMGEWVEIVKALQQITIDQKGEYEKEAFDLKTVSDDPWVAWNLLRDKQVKRD